MTNQRDTAIQPGIFTIAEVEVETKLRDPSTSPWAKLVLESALLRPNPFLAISDVELVVETLRQALNAECLALSRGAQ